MMISGSSLSTTSVLGRDSASDEVAARGERKADAKKIEFAIGDDARARLADEDFRDAWTRLAQGCTWATPWQSLDQAEIWYSVYRETFEPILIFQQGSSGDLIGLLPLAVNRKTGTIVNVGAHQAEYQVWLATQPCANTFIQQALHILSLRYPGQRLRFQYLPSNAPIEWCQNRRPRGLRTILQRRRRPLLHLGPGSRVEESLRKKSNKSRLSRLRRVGPVSLVEFRTSEDLARHIDTIADFCDFRQGAINASLPFRDDPHKRELWLRLMDRPGLVHTSALMVGDEVAAAHIGPIDGTTISLGIIAHSPFFAEHSPGKLLMLMLARELGQQGYKSFDLTPDGAYKDRFADHEDAVHALTVYFDPVGYTIDAAKDRLRKAARRLLSADVQSSVKRAKATAQLQVREVLDRIGFGTTRKISASGPCYYTLPAAAVGEGDDGPLLNVNCIADLLLFEPTRTRSKRQFLTSALQRLEAGDQVYTLTRNGVLVHCAWVGCFKGDETLGFTRNQADSQPSYMVWDDFTVGGVELREAQAHSLLQRLRAVAGRSEKGTILVRLDDPEVLSALEKGPVRNFRACQQVR